MTPWQRKKRNKRSHTQQEWTSRITSEEEHEILGAMWRVLKLCLRTHSSYRVRCCLTRWKSAVFRGDICGISARWEAVCDQNKMVRRGDTKIPKMVNKVERTINWMMVKRNTPHQLPCTGAQLGRRTRLSRKTKRTIKMQDLDGQVRSAYVPLSFLCWTCTQVYEREELGLCVVRSGVIRSVELTGLCPYVCSRKLDY